MNLEEKAEQWSIDNIEGIVDQVAAEYGYIAGYNECKSDLIEFLKVNHRASVKDILNHLDHLK